jgi:hypothetical protein
MEIHDAVMPKMADINRVKRKLNDLLEADSLMVDEKKLLIYSNIDALVNAENGMMDWMKAFKVPKAIDPDQQVLEYLNNEKANISQVSDQMLNSLKKGEELLKQLEKSKENYELGKYECENYFDMLGNKSNVSNKYFI